VLLSLADLHDCFDLPVQPLSENRINARPTSPPFLCFADLMLAVRTRLRAATAPAHAEVDQIFSRFDLSSQAGYRDFLAAHAEALLPVEAWLDSHAPGVIADWPSRRRAQFLADDLAVLGLTTPTAAAAPFTSISHPAAVIGILYVVEGSRLGGRVLARQVPSDLPATYLSPHPNAPSWPGLMQRLDEIVRDEISEEIAIAAALQTFERFAQAGRTSARGSPA